MRHERRDATAAAALAAFRETHPGDDNGVVDGENAPSGGARAGAAVGEAGRRGGRFPSSRTLLAEVLNDVPNKDPSYLLTTKK